MSQYYDGLKDGYEAAGRAVQDVLDLDIPDAEKLKRIGRLVTPEQSAVKS